jgi:hypothetical protein
MLLSKGATAATPGRCSGAALAGLGRTIIIWLTGPGWSPPQRQGFGGGGSSPSPPGKTAVRAHGARDYYRARPMTTPRTARPSSRG